MNTAPLSDTLLCLGVSAQTGRPLSSPSDAAIDALLGLRGETASDSLAAATRGASATRAFAAEGDVDPNELTEAGWGVIFAPEAGEDIKAALQPLLERRQQQAGRLFRVFEGDRGVRVDETAQAWLQRQGVRLDVVDPHLGVPFYLLIVAPPESISFEFQYTVDLCWGVGRVWFSDAAAFRRYAESVVAYETAGTVPTARQVAVFSTRHDFDQATQLFMQQVAEPLCFGSEFVAPVGKRLGYQLQPFLGELATKDALRRILKGETPDGPPALLFTGTHGMEFPAGDRRQTQAQGALVCQDWVGYGGIKEDYWFSGTDIPRDANLQGLVHFLFACHGAGCPAFDNFDRLGAQPKQIAEKPFLAPLPPALLSHPGGGALAVLGHVERAWAYSFQSSNAQPQTQGFRDVIARILRGDRLGYATDAFNVRWAALSTQLAELRQDRDLDRKALARLWVARDDARNYIIFGDPAVRLRAEDMPRTA